MLGDTIVAQASARGGSERAVVRLSGPGARAAAALVFAPELPAVRAQVEGHVRVRGRRVEALALVMVGPRSFTGEDVVELHVPGSALLVQNLLDELLRDGSARGVRLALPGEFTARAVQNGRFDGAAAEGLLLLLHATDAVAAARGLSWLAGGSAAAVQAMRARLQDTLALLEVGLDFDDNDTGAVPASAWTEPLRALTTDLDALLATLPVATPGGEVLLLGRANVGKSSLANALAGRPVVLVDAGAGTTRDLVRIALPSGAVLWDAPGDLEAPVDVDAAALQLRDRLAGGAAGCLWVLDATAPVLPATLAATQLPLLAVVWTKCDDAAEAPPNLPPATAPTVAARLAAVPQFATSAHTGRGVDALRAWLQDTARSGAVDAGGPLRTALQAARAAVARGLAAAAAGPELVAVELQAALQALEGIAGRHSPEHLLDRIYGRFCLGK